LVALTTAGSCQHDSNGVAGQAVQALLPLRAGWPSDRLSGLTIPRCQPTLL